MKGTRSVLNVDVVPGEFIRRRGCDLAEGQKILGSGERIRPTTIALLASQGFADVTVGGQVNAAVVSTGDEVVTPGSKLDRGQIYDSNSVLLQALVQNCGACVKSAEHCPDQRERLIQAIQRGIKSHILVITGGVSVGEHDLVQAALRTLGAKIDIWRVAIKPGKPFLFGQASGCAVFGLPGNPVSAFVTFLQFVRPAILKMMGAKNVDLPKGAGKIGRRSHKRRRSPSLRSRPNRHRDVRAHRAPGIACAFWVEPVECAAAHCYRRVAKSR